MLTKHWTEIAGELSLYSRIESSQHPHAPEERADLYHSADSGSTEYEYLNLLNALILACKPELAFESGTHRGFGTIALTSALKFNGLGTLYSIDRNECSEAHSLTERYGLKECVHFIRSDTLEFCATWLGNPFEFLFFDSDVAIRHRECDILFRRNKIKPGGIGVFHDTSELRFGVPFSSEYLSYVKALPAGIALKGARGIRLVQFA